MKKEVFSKDAPAAIGPYSQAISCAPFLFTSGQIGADPASGNLPEGIEAQAHQALKNLGKVLEAGNSGFDQVLKTIVFLTDMGNFAAVNKVYSEYFKAPYPARSCVAVAQLPKGALVEVEAVATSKE